MIFFRHIAGALVLAGAGQVVAQECEVSLSRNEIDYGQLNRTTLKAVAGEVNLPSRTLNLTVQCAAAQPLGLSYRAIADSPRSFRFGDKGSYELWLSGAQLDGQSVELARVQRGGVGVGRAGGEVALLPEQGLIALQAGQAAPGQQLTARVEVRSRGAEEAVSGAQASEWLAQGMFVSGTGERAFSLRAGFTPASCTPRLGQGGAVDFGQIHAGQLALDRPTLLQRSLSLSVQCDGPTRFALAARDNRAGSARSEAGMHEASLFGIGKGRAGEGIGSYRLRVSSPVADVRLRALSATPAGLDWQRVPEEDAAVRHDGQLLGFMRESEAGLAPGALTNLAAQLQVDLYLAPLRALQLDQEVPIQGSATLEIVYL